MSDLSLIGWWGGNRVMFQDLKIISLLGPASSGFTYCVQSQVNILYLGRGLIPPEELRDLSQTVECISLEEELGLCLTTALSSVQ